MMDEYNKCYFCKCYDEYEGCRALFCEDKKSFIPNKQKIIEKSQDTGLTIVDIVALIEMG